MASSSVARYAGIRHLRLMFLGAPGVGKGTYAQRLTGQLDIPYVASGDLLRNEIAAGTNRGAQLKHLVDAGEFVPDAIVEGMVVDALRRFDEETGFLLDGYPRNLSQASSLDAKGVTLDWVVNLRQPAEVIVAKLSSRRLCPKCGFTYNYASIDHAGIKMDPLVPKVANTCDKCGYCGEFTTRADDKEEVVRARLEKYDADTKPLEEYYKEQGKLVPFDVLGGAKQYLPKLLDELAPLQRR